MSGKNLIGIIIIVIGLIVGIYMGVVWGWIGGIAQVINALNAPVVSGMTVALGCAKTFFAGLIGWACGGIIAFFGSLFL